jgi:hypothetical protein
VARNYIHINTSDVNATRASELQQFIRSLRQTYELGIRIRDVMDHLNDGTSFVDVETRFGLATGIGQTVYNMVKNTVDSIEGDVLSNDGKQLSERVG